MISFQPIVPPIVMLLLIAAPIAAFIWSVAGRGAYESTSSKVAEAVVAVLAGMLAFGIGMRPSVPAAVESDDVKSDVDVLFVVDTTLSMWAKDGDGGGLRRDDVLEDVDLVSEKLPGADYALVTFDDIGKLALPYTSDITSVRDAIETARHPSSLYASGSGMGTPMEATRKFLSSMAQKRTDKVVVVFMSDGEVTDGTGTPGNDLDGLVSGGIVIGYGTEEGAVMEDSDGSLVSDPATGADAVSKLDKASLEGVAGALGVGYAHHSDREAIESALSGIADGSKVSSDAGQVRTRPDDMYFWLALPLAACLVLELFLVVRRKRSVLGA